VLKVFGEYWCYFTGLQPDGRAFGILHSTNLLDWTFIGSALDPLPGDNAHYWAPEVTYHNGRYLMYYSVGPNHDEMHIRVATANHPAGPFIDAGVRLSDEAFAIDPHIFIDDDGRWYLFYATDYLDVDRVGTGTAYAPLADPFQRAGPARPVTRARYDWQVFDPNRAEKGGVCWHTLEGPFVLKHNGQYYQMFSGGNWQNESYGVSYATAPALDAEWVQACDGVSALPILRSDPEQGIYGPGHNSVVRGPDNRELFCVYHRWNLKSGERVLAIDRLAWDGDQLILLGPTAASQPAPRLPDRQGFGGFTSTGPVDLHGADTAILDGQSGPSRLTTELSGSDILLEVSFRVLSTNADGGFGVCLQTTTGEHRLEIDLQQDRIALLSPSGSNGLPASPNLDLTQFQLLRLHVCPGLVDWAIVGQGVHFQVDNRSAPVSLSFEAKGVQVAWAALELSIADGAQTPAEALPPR
jgi:GH43 family beta-xylosidase